MDGSAALFITSWKRNSYGPANWKLILDFCENTLKKKPVEFSKIHCTVLDVDVGDEEKEDAARDGVTLIPASRPEQSDPTEDQPVVTWLLFPEFYYPGLGKLENIRHVVALSQNVKKTAATLQERVFPGAKFHQPPDQPAAAVFINEAWNKDALGLTGFHRTLVQDFCERKEKAGETLKAYSTVLDVKISDDQKNDAENCGVTLIPAQRKEKADDRDDPQKLEWLLNHEIHYPDLREIENVRYVIGYAPKTGRAAADIRRKLFPGAKLVLINHACPEPACLQAEEHGLLKFEEKMLQIASEADILFSIGPCIYNYFENAYRAEVQGRDLSDIPHEEILPWPDTCFWVKGPKEKPVTQHHILTCGQMDIQNAIEGCMSIAAAIGTAANRRKEHYSSHPQWKIQGVSEKAGKTERKILADASKSPYVYPKLQPGHSAKSLLTSLQQSHLCLPSPCYWDYSFYGLEAITFGLPTSVDDDSHLAYFAMKHLEMYADYCVIRDCEVNLSKKIIEHLEKTPDSFKKANAVKMALKDCKAITESFAKFASLLKESTKQENEGDRQGQEVAKSDFPVKVALDEEMLQKRLSEIEELKALSVQLRQLQERKKNEVKAAWGECEHGLKRRVQAVLADEDSCNEVNKVCKEKVGLDPSTLATGCLGILLEILTLYYLYRLKQTCRSRNLAKALEPLLITDEMREIAARVGITLQLKTTYDKVKFEETERVFINRNGGGVQPLTFHDEIEDDDYCNVDSQDEEPPLSQQASDQVVVTASDQAAEQISQTNLEQEFEEKLITQHGEPTQQNTEAKESQTRSLLPIKTNKQQLTDFDIRYSDSAKSNSQLLRSQLEKSCTEKQILEIRLAEEVQEKLQLEKQCQEYMQRCHSAEKVVSTQLSDIHVLKTTLEKLDPKNIENFQTKLQEKDKVITELKTKLSQLSDAQSDIEMQKKIAESLQLGEQVITSETVHKEVPKITEIKEEERPIPEMTVREGSEMETAKPTQPEMTVRDESEMETAKPTQPEMTVRDRSEMETATPTQPEMTDRDESEMETAKPTQPEMTGREGSEMETAKPTQPPGDIVKNNAAMFVAESMGSDLGRCKLFNFFIASLVANLGVTVFVPVLQRDSDGRDLTIDSESGIYKLHPNENRLSKLKNQNPAVDWFHQHQSLYPHFSGFINVVKTVVGYLSVGKESGFLDAAVDFKNSTFRAAKMIHFNLAIPEDYGDTEGEDSAIESIKGDHVAVSLGHLIYEHFENKYEVLEEERPRHLLYLPPVSDKFMNTSVVFRDGKECGQVLSVCDVKTKDDFERYTLGARSMGKLAKVNRDALCQITTWRVIGVKKDVVSAFRTFLEFKADCTSLQVTVSHQSSLNDLKRHLCQSMLFIASERNDSFNFTAYLAMQTGIPVLVPSCSGIVMFLECLFHLKDHAGNCSVQTNVNDASLEEDSDRWKDAMFNMLNPERRKIHFLKAKQLKEDLKNCAELDKSHRDFLKELGVLRR